MDEGTHILYPYLAKLGKASVVFLLILILTANFETCSVSPSSLPLPWHKLFLFYRMVNSFLAPSLHSYSFEG